MLLLHLVRYGLDLLTPHSELGGACWNELPLTTVAVFAEAVLHANRGGVLAYQALGALGVYVLLIGLALIAAIVVAC